MNAAAPVSPAPQPPPVFILAPGRDGELSCRMLQAAGWSCERCRDADDLRSRLSADAGALLVAEEALTQPLVQWLQEHLRQQPPWSDLPVLVVAQEYAPQRDAARLASLGNVMLLTRPMAVADLATAVRSALRARVRQLQVRHLLQQLREEGRRKDEFMAMLAHELRNPLGPVRFAAHALRAEAGTPRLRQLTAVVERQVAHMGRIIAQLLDVSRLAQGRVTLDRERLDLGELARRCVDAHQGAAAERGVDLQARVAGHAWVDGDPTRLGQVVENLLDNAIKFSPRGARVEVEVAAAAGRARLVVCDAGDGIAAADLPFVFQPFVQADKTLDRARGGLGLGLAMVKGLAELHGGAVEVRSDGPGAGSCFTITLPLAAPPDARACRDEADVMAASPSARPLQVLVAEDNEDAAETLRMLLELSGYDVRVARTGLEAVEAARALPPDALLCDIGLPGMSGYEVARTLRAEPGLSGTFMMALTGYGTDRDRAAALAAGFDRHMPKPVNPEQVFRELARLDRRGE